MRFVNSEVGKELRLRGFNARVVAAGVVRPGDHVRVRASGWSGSADVDRLDGLAVLADDDTSLPRRLAWSSPCRRTRTSARSALETCTSSSPLPAKTWSSPRMNATSLPDPRRTSRRRRRRRRDAVVAAAAPDLVGTGAAVELVVTRAAADGVFLRGCRGCRRRRHRRRWCRRRHRPRPRRRRRRDVDHVTGLSAGDVVGVIVAVDFVGVRGRSAGRHDRQCGQAGQKAFSRGAP